MARAASKYVYVLAQAGVAANLDIGLSIDDNRREKLLQEATEIAIGDLRIIPIHYEVSTWGMQKNLTYKARTDQYTLSMDIRPR